jgi:hypothetical protein
MYDKFLLINHLIFPPSGLIIRFPGFSKQSTQIAHTYQGPLLIQFLDCLEPDFFPMSTFSSFSAILIMVSIEHERSISRVLELQLIYLYLSFNRS